METLAVIFGIAWFAAGAVAVALDLKDFPKPVLRGVDEMLRALILVAGPFGLAAVVLMRNLSEFRR
jgi:hypothetical protein